MFFLNGPLQQIDAAEQRIHYHHAQLQHHARAQRARLQATATHPSSLLGIFAAGYIFDRLRPRWRTVSSAFGLGVTAYRYQHVLQSLVGARRRGATDRQQ